jgi:LemA protein
MAFLKKSWLPIIIVLLAIAVYMVAAFNGFVAKEEAVKKYFSELQATYQRRVDLLPNLVSTVKANSDFEKTVLQQVTEARAIAQQATQQALPEGKGFGDMEAAQNNLAVSANRLIAVIENYPNLKATEAFINLQTQIEGTERRINIARKDFNGAVQDYNQAVRKVPASLVAGLLGFKPKEGFTADAGAAQAPEIKF